MAAAAGCGAVSCPVPCRASYSLPSHRVRMQGKAAHRMRVQGEVGGALGVGVKSQIIWPVTKTFGYLLLKNDSWILFFKYLKFSV